jgi:hypothetical protein
MISILFFFVFVECMYTVCPNIRRTTQRSWTFSFDEDAETQEKFPQIKDDDLR